MVAEGNQIAQQRFAIDLAAAVAYLHRAPVRLMGDQAVGLQQVADQLLFHHLFTGGVQQAVGVELIIVDADILLIDAVAGQAGDRRAFQLLDAEQGDAHLALGAGGQIALQRAAHRFPIGERGLVEAVEIQLEAFRFDQVQAVGVEADFADRHLRQPVGVQPGELVQRPDVRAVEGQVIGVQPQRLAVHAARHRLQQRGVVAIAVGGGFAQRQPRQGLVVLI